MQSISYSLLCKWFRTAVFPLDKPLETALLFLDDFTQEMLAQDEASRKAELTQKRKALSGAQKRMEELDKKRHWNRKLKTRRNRLRMWGGSCSLRNGIPTCSHRKTGVTFAAPVSLEIGFTSL